MLDRFERPLRMLCLVLAAALVFELARLVLRGDPLAHLNIPQVPELEAATNGPGANAMKGLASGTNATNINGLGTNTAKALLTGSNAPATNAMKGWASGTNAPNVNALGTNMEKTLLTGSNAPATNVVQSTNQLAAGSKTNGLAGNKGTNATAGIKKEGPPGRRGGMMPPGAMGGGPPLPAAIQSRVDKITDSEVFGPVMHPQPMGLIGIADEEAFIRAPDGETGPVKVNGELGGIKLLRIGMNRVLIEEDGEKKELTMFGGIGGQSLMPKEPPPSTNAMSQTNSLSQTNKLVPPKSKETH